MIGGTDHSAGSETPLLANLVGLLPKLPLLGGWGSGSGVSCCVAVSGDVGDDGWSGVGSLLVELDPQSNVRVVKPAY
jgi:hypothetical protein